MGDRRLFYRRALITTLVVTVCLAAKLALVVGSLLVVINQWEAFNGAAKFDWVKVVLTYCVPYMVSTYTSVSKDLHLRKQVWALQE